MWVSSGFSEKEREGKGSRNCYYYYYYHYYYLFIYLFIYSFSGCYKFKKFVAFLTGAALAEEYKRKAIEASVQAGKRRKKILLNWKIWSTEL